MSQMQNLEELEQRKLSGSEIDELIALSSKDIDIILARTQDLSHSQIKTIAERGVYLALANLTRHQKINSENFEILMGRMFKMPELYKELIEEGKNQKWQRG